jgi:hypothetical protein
MPSPFARLLDFAESAQFRKDSSGRMVFLPLISKGQGFFVDSLSDEEKLRALVRLYRGANVLLGLLWSLLNYLAVLAPGSISSYYRGVVPLHAKLTAVAWVASISLVFYGVAAWGGWNLYKQAIQSFTHAFPKVSPEAVRQLPAVSVGPQRALLVFAGAALLLIAIVLLAAVRHARP